MERNEDQYESFDDSYEVDGIEELAKQITIQIATIVEILAEHELTDLEDYNARMTQVTHRVDQEWERQARLLEEEEEDEE